MNLKLLPHRSMTRHLSMSGGSKWVNLFTMDWKPIPGSGGRTLKEARQNCREHLANHPDLIALYCVP